MSTNNQELALLSAGVTTSTPARARTVMQLLLTACLGACAAGADGPSQGDTAPDTGMMARDSGAGADASDAAHHPDDAESSDAALDAEGVPGVDASELDADAEDRDSAAQDAGADADDGDSAALDAGVDAALDAGTDAAPGDAGTLDGGDGGPDADGSIPPDASDGGDAAPEASLPPVNCADLVRTGVQLCDSDRTADTCGALFTNSIGCTATCAAGGLACDAAYENLDNPEPQCARDTARPAPLPCNSGHISDYCVCRRP